MNLFNGKDWTRIAIYNLGDMKMSVFLLLSALWIRMKRNQPPRSKVKICIYSEEWGCVKGRPADCTQLWLNWVYFAYPLARWALCVFTYTLRAAQSGDVGRSFSPKLASRTLQNPWHLSEASEMPIADPMKKKKIKKIPFPIRYPLITLVFSVS
jgi:hypothetical protein